MSISSILFVLVLLAAVGLFTKNILRLKRNIDLGLPEERNDRKGERWATMARVALGQGKMVVRPIPGILHVLVYAGFVIINFAVDLIYALLDPRIRHARAIA